MRKFFASVFLFILFVSIDQAAKHLAYTKEMGGFLNFLRPVFGFQIFPNRDLAFSIHLPVVLMWSIYVLLLILLTVWFIKQKPKNWLLVLAFTLILAGALSNIFDRLSLGYVRDFIFVFWGNVFNPADIFIVAGILILLF